MQKDETIQMKSYLLTLLIVIVSQPEALVGSSVMITSTITDPYM
jgi:hypothetical protein